MIHSDHNLVKLLDCTYSFDDYMVALTIIAIGGYLKEVTDEAYHDN